MGEKDESSEQDSDGSIAKNMSYGDYLHMDKILGAQFPLSKAHDELLFIIQHQTSELWMHLVLHEIQAARKLIEQHELSPAFKMLTRVSRIFDQLNSAWDVLRTMTPSEYTEFRGALGQSSGFQSHQYRLIEFSLGNRNTAMMRMHEKTPDRHALLETELRNPTLYHVALHVLAHELQIKLPKDVFKLRGPHISSPAIVDAWTRVYKEPEQYWALYELAEKLVDLEDYFRRWRFSHVTTVERIIGFKQGTGGTNGVKYLRSMLEVELFPELWYLRGGL